MKLNKTTIRGILALVIILAVFQILAFVIPFPHGGPFWVGFAFGLIAILIQLPILYLAFQNTQIPRSKIYGIPIARVGVAYGVAQMILSYISMALGFIPGFPYWVPLVLSVLLLAAAALGVLATDATRDEVERQDEVLRRDTTRMRALQAFSKDLAANCPNPEAAADLKKLADRIRYSDPVSSPATIEYEERLSAMLEELRGAMGNGDAAYINRVSKQAITLLDDRNRICKLGKSV